jgi:hypothetical protein
MQHYRLPTRLLDWTESALIGLYFAVSDSDDDEADGALWALDPTRMNELVLGAKGTLAPDETVVAPLMNIHADPSSLEDRDVAALTPAQADPRTMIQLSCFTIHANATPLDGRPNSEAFLRKIVIDARSKHAVRASLKELGLTNSYLFPDLEHLAEEERNRCFCLKTPCPNASHGLTSA